VKQINGAPLQRIVLKDRVAELIKDAILNGRLEPGDRIVEMKVASDLGVGTTAVREALFELESQGFVSRITNKGTFVTELTADDVEQILRVRRELEGLAIELLQERGTEADFLALEKLVQDMRSAAVEGNFQGFYRSDLEFHRTIWSMSGNRFVAKALDNTVVPLFAFFIMKNPRDSVADLVASVGKHAEVVRALRNHEDARKYMEGAIKFFAQQEKRLLFEAQPKQA
jgi:DNA-binding GntR family transcriptional regulator